MGSVVSKNELKKPEPSEGAESKVEEEFTVARLYVSKMKSEVKNLVNRASMLETGNLNFPFQKNFRIFYFTKKKMFSVLHFCSISREKILTNFTNFFSN